ncbi:LysM peptidoglycan-binding domain-containing protein [Clostridium swellfunianum]|uniref:LysM peptidoglycan-binding domain-containing protein n=1 Tax=Clostridium swellfunianum TaxID=1367462 RepID=UPI00202F6610|nr:LysM peptidoglycan-binding domain-containing protein [Clostridium swellfunianum]MCM0647937.1 LysM peptidoglycan-binding domain-containing protein [Clostridium swellfunianum]
MKRKLLSVVVSAIILSSTFIPTAAFAAETQTTYNVVSGDSLWRIAAAYKVSVSDLKSWNGLTSDVIYVGQTLKVSPIHIVQVGDTLWLISRKYGTTVDSLVKLNNLTTTTLKIGQVIKIAETAAPISVSTGTIEYKVVSGDNLSTLAKKYGTTVEDIMKLNNLTSTTIYVGQVLKIQGSLVQTPAPAPVPSAPVIETVNYKVVSGDNLWTLAQKYKTTVDAIMKTNMLVKDYVMPNQILTIPVNSNVATKPVGITMMTARVNSNYGDIYTWDNAMRLWTVGTTGTLRDLATGKTFNIRYYGGSNHSDIVTLTQQDTDIMKSIYGTWSWNNDHKRPMVLTFTKGGVNYQMAVSLTGMPHSSTDNYTNGMAGHCDLYFYNSVGHSDPVIDPVHQANILKANGR